VYNAAKTGADLVEGMERYYGDVKAEDFAIHWQARLLFPNSVRRRSAQRVRGHQCS